MTKKKKLRVSRFFLQKTSPLVSSYFLNASARLQYITVQPPGGFGPRPRFLIITLSPRINFFITSQMKNFFFRLAVVSPLRHEPPHPLSTLRRPHPTLRPRLDLPVQGLLSSRGAQPPGQLSSVGQEGPGPPLLSGLLFGFPGTLRSPPSHPLLGL